jgi:hypothetical protein
MPSRSPPRLRRRTQDLQRRGGKGWRRTGIHARDQRGIGGRGPRIHARDLRHVWGGGPGIHAWISATSEEEDPGSMPRICNGATIKEGGGPGSIPRICNPQKSVLKKEIYSSEMIVILKQGS